MGEFAHHIGTDVSDGSETSSDRGSCSGDDSVSSSDSDTPIIATSRRDPSIQVSVHRLPRTSNIEFEDAGSLYPSDEVFYQYHSRDTVHPRDAQDRWTS